MPALGSNINAALGRQDYSAMLRGGENMANSIKQAGQLKAQGFAAMGQGITQGIQKYQAKQEEKKVLEGTRNMLENAFKDEALVKALGVSPGDDGMWDKGELNAVIESAGGPDKITAWVGKGQQMASQQKQIAQAQTNAETDQRLRRDTLDANIKQAGQAFTQAENQNDFNNNLNTRRTDLEERRVEVAETPTVAKQTEYESKYNRAVDAAIETNGGEPLTAVQLSAIDSKLTAEMTAGEAAYYATGGGLAATADRAGFEAAGEGAAKYGKVMDTIDRIENSTANIGVFSELKTAFDKALVVTFGNKEAAGRVADTEVLEAVTSSAVFVLLKELGIGARGLDTPAEVKFLRQAFTGTPSMQKAALLELAKISAQQSVDAVDSWNERSSTGSNDPFYQTEGNQGLQREFFLPTSVSGGTDLGDGFTLNGSK